MSRAIEELRSQLVAGSRQALQAPLDGEPVDLQEMVDEAVANALREAENESAPSLKPFDLGITMRDLLDPLLSEEERAQLWKKIRDGGQIDAIVAEFERLSRDSPRDTQAHTDLGAAYLNKMLTLQGPAAGEYGSKAHRSLLKALELDPKNWEARFAAAQHEYWAGLSQDSLQNFKVLVKQQVDRINEPQHAQAFLWLGNLYMDSGEREPRWKHGIRDWHTSPVTHCYPGANCRL